MNRVWCALGTCSLLLLLSACGGVEGMPQDQRTPWEDLETSVTESPEVAADEEVGTVEQSVTTWTCWIGNVLVPNCHSCNVWVNGWRYGSSIYQPTEAACRNWCVSTCGHVHGYYRFYPGYWYYTGNTLRWSNSHCTCYW